MDDAHTSVAIMGESTNGKVGLLGWKLLAGFELMLWVCQKEMQPGNGEKCVWRCSWFGALWLGLATPWLPLV